MDVGPVEGRVDQGPAHASPSCVGMGCGLADVRRPLRTQARGLGSELDGEQTHVPPIEAGDEVGGAALVKA